MAKGKGKIRIKLVTRFEFSRIRKLENGWKLVVVEVNCAEYENR